MLKAIKKDEKDRRKKFRFPICREVRYKVLENDMVVAAGSGETLNMGSGGMALVVDRELNPGALVELSISWPVLLDASCPMRLVVFGRLLRSLGRRAVCTIEKYEFRTQGRVLQAIGRTDTMLLRWADTIRKEELKVRELSA
jgi:hypothetical protein